MQNCKIPEKKEIKKQNERYTLRCRFSDQLAVHSKGFPNLSNALYVTTHLHTQASPSRLLSFSVYLQQECKRN
jgi:hypothetical protein